DQRELRIQVQKGTQLAAGGCRGERSRDQLHTGDLTGEHRMPPLLGGGGAKICQRPIRRVLGGGPRRMLTLLHVIRLTSRGALHRSNLQPVTSLYGILRRRRYFGCRWGDNVGEDGSSANHD